MKRNTQVLATITALLLLVGFLFAGCEGSSGPSAEDQVTVLLTPETSTTFQLGQATVSFPEHSVTKKVFCFAALNRDTSSLPNNITPVSGIYSLTLSDPDAYNPDTTGSVTFSITAPLQDCIFSNYAKYSLTQAAPGTWYNIGGHVGNDTIEAPIPTGQCLFVVGTQAGGDTNMRKGPYLILSGGAGSVTVQWQVLSGCKKDADLYWGPEHHDDPSDYPNHEKIASDDNLFFSKEISGLPPAARTYYCVSIVNSGSGDTFSYQGSFMAPPPEDAKTVSFYAYGDTKSFPVDHDRVLHYMETDSRDNGMQDTRQTFIIHLGDLTGKGLEEPRWDSEYFYYRKLTSTNEAYATFPTMAAVGNHEYHYDVNGHTAYGTPAKLLRYYFHYPMYQTKENCYYSFDYGPVHIICMDLYSAKYAPGTPQYEWLKKDLLDSKKPWKMVGFHHPAYCANKDEKDDGYADTTDIRKYLCPIFEDPRYGVNLVLQGHWHNYVRAIVNNLNYVTVGGGGAGLFNLDYPLPSYVVCAKKEYCFARIEADETSLKLTALNANEDSFLQTIDYVEISK